MGVSLALSILLFTLTRIAAAGSEIPQVIPPAQIGTARTVAGPGFCDGRSVAEPLTAAVGGLVVSPSGRFDVQVGEPERGLLVSVAPDGIVTHLVSGAGGAGLSPGGQLAPDGGDGVMAISDRRVVDVSPGGNFRTIVGGFPARSAGAAPQIGEAVPAGLSRFGPISSLTSDAVGNLFVADASDLGRGTARVSFMNRTGSGVAIRAGTAGALSVAPGTVVTIWSDAGGSATGSGQLPSGPVRTMAVGPGRLYLGMGGAPGTGPPSADRVLMLNLSESRVSAHGVAILPGEARLVTGVDRVDPAPGRRSKLGSVGGMAADARGNLYLADPLQQRVFRLDADGRLAVMAGSGPAGPEGGGFNGNERSALDARLNRPVDVKLASDGRVYISDQLNGEVRIIDQGGVIHAAPGAGEGMRWICGSGPQDRTGAALVRPGGPFGIAVGPSGAGYVSNADGQQVKLIEPDGAVTTVVGLPLTDASCLTVKGCVGTGGDGGPARRARLDTPYAVAADSSSGIYVLDSGNARVRFANLGSRPVSVHGIHVAAGTVMTVAGDGSPGSAGDGGRASRAEVAGVGRLASIPGSTEDRLLAADVAHGGDVPTALGALAVDHGGNLFIADTGNHRVRLVDPRGTITTFAGRGAPEGRAGCCDVPQGLATDGAGNLYVADQASNRVWLINRAPRPVIALGRTTLPGEAVPVAGDGALGQGGEGGPALAAELHDPLAIAVDRRGRLFIGETVGTVGYVRMVDTDGVIRTLLGSGRASFNGDGRPGRLTALGMPTGLALDACDNLLVADPVNDRVRRLDLMADCRPRMGGGTAALQSGPHPGGMSPWVVAAGGALLALVSGSVVAATRHREHRGSAPGR